ncbi:hypothetical protein QUA54_04740 [Microcoleus sp. MOSTC5]
MVVTPTAQCRCEQSSPFYSTDKRVNLSVVGPHRYRTANRSRSLVGKSQMPRFAATSI